MKNLHLLAVLVLVFICSCSQTSSLKSVGKGNLKEWILEVTPNNLNKVGVIFGINARGQYIKVPGGELQLKTKIDSISLPFHSQTLDITYGSVARFLNNETDSANVISAFDSLSLNSTFSVRNAVLTVIDNDRISTAFERQREIMEDNMRFMDLDSTKFYLIYETIQSSDVNLRINKVKNGSLNLSSIIEKLIGLNGNLSRAADNTNELIYKSFQPRTIFFKLIKLNVKYIYEKGTPQKNVFLSLDEN